MKVHPELRERFEEACKYYLNCNRTKTLTLEEIYQIVRLQVFKEQKKMLGEGYLEGMSIQKNCGHIWVFQCDDDCDSTTEYRVERVKPNTNKTTLQGMYNTWVSLPNDLGKFWR